MRKIAHRSGPTIYPEQTLFSAKEALKNGADMVEIDTRFTEDGAIVVSHDCNTFRVFGVDREIDEMSLSEYKSLRHKAASEYPAHTLRDYMDAKIAPLLIHVKEGGERLPELLEALRQKDYLGKVVLGLSGKDDIAFVRKAEPTAKILAFMGRPEQLRECAEVGADFLRLWEDWITTERIDEIHALGKECWIMVGRGETVGETSEESLQKILALPIDGILINNITRI